MPLRPVLVCVLALAASACTLRDPEMTRAPSYSPANAAPPTLSVASNELVGPVWHWQGTRAADGRTIRAEAPDRYTLAFQGGGRVFVRADCNRGSGSYEVNGNAMKMGPVALTKMGCPPDSQDGVFTTALARATSYSIAGGELALTLADGGAMRFRAGP